MIDSLKTIAIWGKFVGIFMITSGAIFILCSFAFFWAGVIPGAITVILGLNLLSSANSANSLLEEKKEREQTPQSLNEKMLEAMLKDYGAYLKVSGITNIVIIALCVITITALTMFILLGFEGLGEYRL